MQQFMVPQFLDIEDKIIGPVTVRQFVILLVTGLFEFITFKLADFTLFLFLGFIWLAIGLVLAFVRINGQPFHFFLLNLIQTARKPFLRIWAKDWTAAELSGFINQTSEETKAAPAPHRPPVTASRLNELALIVNTGGAYNPEE